MPGDRFTPPLAPPPPPPAAPPAPPPRRLVPSCRRPWIFSRAEPGAAPPPPLRPAGVGLGVRPAVAVVAVAVATSVARPQGRRTRGERRAPRNGRRGPGGGRGGGCGGRGRRSRRAPRTSGRRRSPGRRGVVVEKVAVVGLRPEADVFPRRRWRRRPPTPPVSSASSSSGPARTVSGLTASISGTGGQPVGPRSATERGHAGPALDTGWAAEGRSAAAAPAQISTLGPTPPPPPAPPSPPPPPPASSVREPVATAAVTSAAPLGASRPVVYGPRAVGPIG